MPRDRPRPWRPPPRCPRCGRPVHRVPTAAGGTADLTMMPACPAGYSFRPHVCPPRGARYPLAHTAN